MSSTVKMATQQAALRFYLGIIASVIFVSMAAVCAAVLIIRKYCFPSNEATYRYSLLRRGSAAMEAGDDGGSGAAGDKSDEDLLE